MTASQKGMVVLIQKFGNIRNYVLMPFKGGHPQENKLNDKVSLNTSDREFNQHRSAFMILPNFYINFSEKKLWSISSRLQTGIGSHYLIWNLDTLTTSSTPFSNLKYFK